MRINPIEFIQNNIDSLHEILDLIPLPMYIKDISGKYIACNKAFEKVSGLFLKDIVGKDVYEVWPKEQADIFYAQDKALYENIGTQDVELEVNTPDGTHNTIQFHKKIFYDNNKRPAGYLCILFDVTEKKSLEGQLQFQALTDELTQLPNRREGLARLEQALSLALRKESALCVALLDIDHFKSVNDNYGHIVGDQALVTVANTIKSSLRGYDICARYGGEEFLICLPDSDLSNSLEVLERVRLACESLKIANKGMADLSITVSIGVAQFASHVSTLEALIEASDLALYQAKVGGRNRVVHLAK